MLLSRFRPQSKLLLCNELFDTQSSCLKNKPRCFHRFRYKNEHGSITSLLLLVATHHIKNTLYFCDLSRFTKSAQLWEVRKSRLRSIYIKAGYSSVITREYSMGFINGRTKNKSSVLTNNSSSCSNFLHKYIINYPILDFESFATTLSTDSVFELTYRLNISA